MPPKKKKKKKLEELRVALTLSSHWMASSLKSKEGSLRSSALSVPYTRRNVAAAVSAAGPLAPAPAAAIDPRPPLRRADPRPRAAGRAEERRRTEEQRAAQPSRWRRRDGAGGFRCVASGVRAWRARARPNRSRAVGVVTYTSCRLRREICCGFSDSSRRAQANVPCVRAWVDWSERHRRPRSRGVVDDVVGGVVVLDASRSDGDVVCPRLKGPTTRVCLDPGGKNRPRLHHYFPCAGSRGGEGPQGFQTSELYLHCTTIRVTAFQRAYVSIFRWKWEADSAKDHEFDG